MAKKITFNPLSNNFDYTTDTTPIEAEIANKQAKVTDAEKNHIAMFNDLGQTVDSGFSTDDFRKKSETVNIDDVENLSDIIAEKMTANDMQAMIDATHSEEPWGADSNANNYKTSGVYQFAGWRKNPNDNLPITNYDEDDVDRNNIAFTLIVNTKDGYLLRNDEGNVTRNIPTMIAQTLMLGNRRGSDTKIYTRHGQTNLATNTTTWEAWREVMTSTYLGTVDSYTGDVLNATTEIGLYTGAMVDMASNTADVFKLEVINNYAVTTQVSGASIPNSVLQTITILDLNGNNTTKKRTGTYGDSGYTWSEWKEEVGGVSTTKFKRGDVVYYSNYDEKDHFGVMPFEDYVKNPTSDKRTRLPIGLVADPVKRTFVFTDLITNDFVTNTSYISRFLASYTSYDNGQETAKRLSTVYDYVRGDILNAYFPAFYDLRYNHRSSGCFYLKQNNAYIPSIQEWEDVYSLCVGMYDASQMDRLICLKNGVTPVKETYIGAFYQFYGQTSSVGNSQNLFPLNLVGYETSAFNSNWKCCPVFGIYTEEEENNYPEF